MVFSLSCADSSQQVPSTFIKFLFLARLCPERNCTLVSVHFGTNKIPTALYYYLDLVTQ